jgi:colicin import membrane protein
MASEHIYVKMIKKWGGFRVGDVVRFGRTKGEARIRAGEGEQVKRQRVVNEPAAIEMAMLDTKAKPDAKAQAAKAAAEAKAKAEADAKAQAEADAKAKAEAKVDAKGKGKGQSPGKKGGKR